MALTVKDGIYHIFFLLQSLQIVMTGIKSIPLTFSFEIYPWVNWTLFFYVSGCCRLNFTVLGSKILFWHYTLNKNSTHSSVAAIHLCENQQTLFKTGKTGGHLTLEGQSPSQRHHETAHHVWVHFEKGFGFPKRNWEALVADCKPGSGRPTLKNENNQRAMRGSFSLFPPALPSRWRRAFLFGRCDCESNLAHILEEAWAPIQGDGQEAPPHPENEGAEAGICPPVQPPGDGQLETSHVHWLESLWAEIWKPGLLLQKASGLRQVQGEIHEEGGQASS